MIQKKDLFILILSIILAILTYFLLYIGLPNYATLTAFILYSIAIGMSFVLLYEIISFVIGKGSINPIHFLYPVLFAYAYFMAKKSVTGVIAESVGAKGLLPAIIRITSYFTGELGAWHQVLGVWIGFITFGAAFALIFYAITQASLGRLTYDEAKFISILAGFGIASGFVTAHLAQSGYMYPFTIFTTIGTTVLYVPMYVISFIVSMICILAAIYFLFIKK